MAHKILVVEDEPSLAKALQKSIKALGYDVHVAVDGEDALKQLSKQEFGLILLDIIMPKKNGLQVLKTLRVDYKSATPVIILSNLEKNEAIEACESYGIQEYIIKTDITIAELTDKIDKVFK